MLGQIMMISSVLIATSAPSECEYPVNDIYKKFVGSCLNEYQGLLNSCNDEFLEFCGHVKVFLEKFNKKHNLHKNYTFEYSIDKNGKVERFNRLKLNVNEIIEFLGALSNIKSYIYKSTANHQNIYFISLEEILYQFYNTVGISQEQSTLDTDKYFKDFATKLVKIYKQTVEMDFVCTKRMESDLVEFNNEIFNNDEFYDKDQLIKFAAENVHSMILKEIYLTSNDLKSILKSRNLSSSLKKKISDIVKKAGEGSIFFN